MESYEKIRDDLKKELSSKRYLHSLRVVTEAKKLAKKYQIDTHKMALTALAHDCTKEWTLDASLSFLQAHQMVVREEDCFFPSVLHGKTASVLCAEKYHFDEEMCTAISYHTTGNTKMDLFAKILFLADKIEKKKEYEGVELLRKMAYYNIDAALLFYLNIKIKEARKKNTSLHSDSYFLQRLLFSQVFYETLAMQNLEKENILTFPTFISKEK